MPHNRPRVAERMQYDLRELLVRAERRPCEIGSRRMGTRVANWLHTNAAMRCAFVAKSNRFCGIIRELIDNPSSRDEHGGGPFRGEMLGESRGFRTNRPPDRRVDDEGHAVREGGASESGLHNPRGEAVRSGGGARLPIRELDARQGCEA